MIIKNYKLQKKKNWINFFPFHFFRYHRIFFGSLIFKGQKLRAFNLFNKLKVLLKKKFNKDPNFIFLLSLSQITPSILLFPFKIGGKIQGVPLSISWKKKWTYATKWVVKLLKDKSRIIKLKELSDLLILAIFNKGLAIKKKQYYNTISSKNRYLMKFFK
jgi:ribosomal protein S7